MSHGRAEVLPVSLFLVIYLLTNIDLKLPNCSPELTQKEFQSKISLHLLKQHYVVYEHGSLNVGEVL